MADDTKRATIYFFSHWNIGTEMETFDQSEALHRLVKQALDNGTATTLEEAEAIFKGYRLAFTVNGSAANDPQSQIALITGVALARRVFLGGVFVEGLIDVPLLIPMPMGSTLKEAVLNVGGIISDIPPDMPLITIGGRSEALRQGFHIRTEYAGWRGGIVPANSEFAPAAGPTVPLAPILSAALAVNEAFIHVSQGTPAAGRRISGLSLWNPQPDVDWLQDSANEVPLTFLPSKLWLIGLGHLGQAYLWALGMLPYSKNEELSLVLQDFDRITPSTESTSILTDSSITGQKKTRAMATWAERRGFSSTIQERLFSDDFRRQSNEPTVAFCGLDNALGRRALDKVGFDLVIEAGLGRGHKDFHTMSLHTLPGPRPAADIWKDLPNTAAVPIQAAYRELLKSGKTDQCGVTLLAGKAVGAPFVGSIAACLALSEVLRLLHGGSVHQLMDIDIQSLEHRNIIPHPHDFSTLNPGFLRVKGRADFTQNRQAFLKEHLALQQPLPG